MYKLKKGQEAFTVVEGPLAGRTFGPGKTYAEIPAGAKGKFEAIADVAPAAATDLAAKKAAKKGAEAPEGEV